MPEVRDTTEYRRICDLPRRKLNERDAAAWAAVLTKELRRPGSTAELRPWQGFALAEAAAMGGALLGLGVGHGKTLLSWLLPAVLASLRSVLIIPAALREKTYADFAALQKDWPSRTPPVIVTREELSTEAGQKRLFDLDPDLIIIDECDELANPDASATKRIDRFVVAKQEAVRVVCMTGTLSRKSIMNYWHLLCWCLRDCAPVPLTRSEAKEWAQAIDESKSRDGDARMGPGVLGSTSVSARAWYRSRLLESPGVVIVDGDSCQAPLTVRVVLADEDPRLDKAYRLFLKGDLANGRPPLETNDGISVSDPLSRWRIDGQYGCGLYLRWKRRPPKEWRRAYQAKNGFVRAKIDSTARSSRPCDTEMQVLRRYAQHPIVTEWMRVRDTFDPETEAVWLSDSTIQSVRAWLASSSAPGIVWTGCVEFARALSVATRLPYYGAQGKCAGGTGLHQANPRRSLIASWYANKRGFNLQAWTRQLLVMPPQSAKYLEQIFGRSHRAGQEDHVRVDVLATSGGTLDALEAAIREASFARDTVGMTQKLLRSSVEWATPKITDSNRFRWGRKTGAKRTANIFARAFQNLP
jgi:hypothetical protein